jgi:hypothetical protein
VEREESLAERVLILLLLVYVGIAALTPLYTQSEM